jgi:predicted RecA/RadA family phage recombinase
MTTYQQAGEFIDYTPGSDVAAGAVVAGTDRAVIAPRAIASGALGQVQTSGVFRDVPKTTGTAWTFMQKLYWDVADGEVTTLPDSGTNKVIGYAAAAAASGDAVGDVLLGT